MRGEYLIETQILNGKEIISGSADYVLGYDPTGLSIPKAFKSTSVLIEAKKYLKGDGGWPQVVAYMVVQQQRMHWMQTAQGQPRGIC
jgi:hypothetical protein